MTAFFAAIVDFVSAHPHFAYGAVFLLALSEAMPVIGTMVPGSTLILGISALAPRGIVQLWPLLIAAIMGAIAGDALSFWLGHRYHRGILLLWPLNHRGTDTTNQRLHGLELATIFDDALSLPATLAVPRQCPFMTHLRAVATPR